MREIYAHLYIPMPVYMIAQIAHKRKIIVDVAAYSTVERIERVPAGIVLGHIAYTVTNAQGPFQLAAGNERKGDIGINAIAASVNGVYAIIGISNADAYDRVSATLLPFLAAVGLKLEVN